MGQGRVVERVGVVGEDAGVGLQLLGTVPGYLGRDAGKDHAVHLVGVAEAREVLLVEELRRKPAGQDGPDRSSAVLDGRGKDECTVERVEFADGGAFLPGAAGDLPKPVLIPG